MPADRARKDSTLVPCYHEFRAENEDSIRKAGLIAPRQGRKMIFRPPERQGDPCNYQSFFCSDVPHEYLAWIWVDPKTTYVVSSQVRITSPALLDATKMTIQEYWDLVRTYRGITKAARPYKVRYNFLSGEWATNVSEASDWKAPPWCNMHPVGSFEVAMEVERILGETDMVMTVG